MVPLSNESNNHLKTILFFVAVKMVFTDVEITVCQSVWIKQPSKDNTIVIWYCLIIGELIVFVAVKMGFTDVEIAVCLSWVKEKVKISNVKLREINIVPIMLEWFKNI